MDIKQGQSNEPDNLSSNKVNTNQYLLTSLLPVAGILLWFVIGYYWMIVEESDMLATFLGVFIIILGASLIGGVISFFVNLFVPFANTARRAVVISIPALALTILVLAGFGDIFEIVLDSAPFCIIFAVLSLAVSVSLLGFIGAKIGGRLATKKLRNDV